MEGLLIDQLQTAPFFWYRFFPVSPIRLLIKESSFGNNTFIWKYVRYILYIRLRPFKRCFRLWKSIVGKKTGIFIKNIRFRSAFMYNQMMGKGFEAYLSAFFILQWKGFLLFRIKMTVSKERPFICWSLVENPQKEKETIGWRVYDFKKGIFMLVL